MHILLIEDNHYDAYLLREFLAEKKDAPQVHWVIDGHEALDYIAKRAEYKDAVRPDLILLDLGLPRVNGYEVLKHLKKEKEFANIPVVVLTTSRNPLDHNQCESLGADSFITKPNDLKGYEVMVEQLMRHEFPRLSPSKQQASG